MSEKIGTHGSTEDADNREIQQFPFTSERRRMSSVREMGERYADVDVSALLEGATVLAMKGATDSVLEVADRFYRDGEVVPITPEDRDRARAKTKEYSAQAMRVLAIAFRVLDPAHGEYEMEEAETQVVFLGLVGMIDPPKEGIREAIAYHVEGMREDGTAVPPPGSQVEYVDVTA